VALNIINHETPEDMQRLASLQGLDLIFSNVSEKEDFSLDSNAFKKCIYGVFGVENTLPVELQQQQQQQQQQNSKKVGPISSSGPPNYPPPPPPPAVLSSSSSTMNSNTNINSAPHKLHVKEIIIAIRCLTSFEDVFEDMKTSPLCALPDLTTSSNHHSSMNQFLLKCLSGELIPLETISEMLDNLSSSLHFLSSSGSKVESSGLQYVRRSVLFYCFHLLSEIGPSLLRFSTSNYHITFLGHGFGGAVASLLTYLLKPFLTNVFGVTYGVLPFCDLVTAKAMNEMLLSLVLHDDLVSRLSPQSCGQLIAELMKFRTQVFQQPKQSWNDILTRSLTAVVSNAETEDAHEKVGNENAIREETNLEISLKVNFLFDNFPVYIPGRILHIYFYRGQYLSSYLLPDCEVFQKIEIQEHCLSDHKCGELMNALLEVRLTNKSSSSSTTAMSLSVPPKWISFDESLSCACCKTRFSWYSMIFKENEVYRQKYHCRYCGLVVCGSCSQQKKSILKYGMLFPRRICDRCFLSGEYAFN
jgi:hypothetical protein